MSWRLGLLNKSVVSVSKVNKNRFRINARGMVISHNLVGKCVSVYTGRSYNTFIVNDGMVGFKFGEFVFTKIFGKRIHKNNRLQIKKRKKLMTLKQYKVRKKRTLKKQKRVGRQYNK